MEMPGTLFAAPTRDDHDGAERSASSTPPERPPLSFRTGYGVHRRGKRHGRPEEDNGQLLVSGGETNTL